MIAKPRFGRWHTRYTIETRPLTQLHSRRSLYDTEDARTVVEAKDPGEALSEFIRDGHSEVVSFQKTAGKESIATVRRNDAMFLVRVYAD